VVFEVRGISSKSPTMTDDVKVTVSPNDFVANPKLEIKVNIPDNIWSGFPTTATVKVTNQGNSDQMPTVLSLSSGKISILGSKETAIGPIPPFGSATYEFNLRTPNVWQNFNDTIVINVGNQSLSKDIEVKPFIFFKPFPFVFIGLMVLIGGIYGTILGIHIYRKRFAKTK
jgi:hypothetical protein